MPEKKFTDEEVAQLKQAFALFDLDGNGFITNDELGTVLRKMGQEPTDEEVDAMIAEIDEDGDGAFDYSGCDYGGKTMRTNALVLIFVLECIHRLQILSMIDMKKNQNKTKKHLKTPSWEKSGTAERIHRLCCANTHVVCEEGRTQVSHWFILFLAFNVFCVFFRCL